MLRIPAPGRVEDRTVDGSANPYLAATVILAAGLDGIENRIDAGEPNSENLYSIPYDELRSRGLETLPTNLLNATMSSRATTSSARRSAKRATRTTSTTSSR